MKQPEEVDELGIALIIFFIVVAIVTLIKVCDNAKITRRADDTVSYFNFYKSDNKSWESNSK